MSSPRIAVLPEASRCILRSTTILTSLPQIVFELVQNSLDSGASRVDVGVDTEAWSCWVRDDGHGMDDAGMSVIAKGGEEGRYGEPLSLDATFFVQKFKGTSKVYDIASLENVSTFGFRGEGKLHSCIASVLAF